MVSPPASRLAVAGALLCAVAMAFPQSPARATAPAPACKSAPCVGDQQPVVILSYWRGRHVPRLVRAIDNSGLPAGTPLYYGNYWGAGKPSEPKPPKGKKKVRMPGRQAPIFPLMTKSVFWRARKIPAAQRHLLPPSIRWARRGRIPRPKRLMKMGNGARYLWGLELGRRFRNRRRARQHPLRPARRPPARATGSRS